MTEQQRISYEILKFLNQPSVRDDINITDEILAYQLRKFDHKAYDLERKGLAIEKAITKTSPNGNWQITEIGEQKLSTLSRQLVKDNPVAAELQDELTALQITVYRNQAKEFKQRSWRDPIKFLSGAGIALASVYLTHYLNKSGENTKYQIEVSKQSPIDTIYIMNPPDSITLKKR